jgi:periplasmic divalent cation tolerance protein
VLLVIKCARGRVPALERHVRTAHPYDVPELVVLVPEHVEARYLAWLLAESRPARGR